MRVPDDHLLALTYALRRPDTAAAAADALRGRTERAAVEGLVELLDDPPSARAALAAITALDGTDDPIIRDALRRVLTSPHASVRLAAVQSLQRRGAAAEQDAFVRLLRRDESWLVRRAALEALAELPGPDAWSVLHAATDPHWRVRHALIQFLLRWGETETQRKLIGWRLGLLEVDARARGVRDYLRFRWTGQLPAPESVAPEPCHALPFWDWDAAVLARNLAELGDFGRRQALDAMPQLVRHADGRVRSLALDALRHWGEPRHLAETLRLLDEPRDGTVEPISSLLDSLDLDRVEDVIRFVFHSTQSSPAQLAWALDQMGIARPYEEEQDRLFGYMLQSPGLPAEVRCALARLAGRWSPPEAGHWLQTFLEDPDPDVRRAATRPSPGPNNPPPAPDEAAPPPDRAAALTPARADELVRDPTRETSWHVLAQAARLCRVPLWALEPEHPWQPPPTPGPASAPLELKRAEPAHSRLLGPNRVEVTPLGISGHYGLPVAGFVRAVEAGVNLLFWEPNYQTLTEFAARLSGPDRGSLHFIAGTFEADARRIRRDAERALRSLKVERLTLFLMFWVQSWARVTPEVCDALHRLKGSGNVAAFGLSTHVQPLAVEAMAAGWDPVMVRHSAAHRGAEPQVFPRAVELGTSLITFNNTCYGRLLRPEEGMPPVSAADCYRYALAQPGVRACLSAPATLEQLDEDLAGLHDLALPPERKQFLLERGARLYQEETGFRQLVRAR